MAYKITLNILNISENNDIIYKVNSELSVHYNKSCIDIFTLILTRNIIKDTYSLWLTYHYDNHREYTNKIKNVPYFYQCDINNKSIFKWILKNWEYITQC